jgi:hypothetical protein
VTRAKSLFEPKMPPLASDLPTYRELADVSARKWIEKPRKSFERA